MKWTIEKVRELPKDNWLGIKRVGEHMWEISSGEMTMYTGDGGVLEYIKVLMETLNDKQSFDYVQDDAPQYKRLDPITPEYLEALIKEELFSNCKKDGMA